MSEADSLLVSVRFAAVAVLLTVVAMHAVAVHARRVEARRRCIGVVGMGAFSVRMSGSVLVRVRLATLRRGLLSFAAATGAEGKREYCGENE